jgi:ABC-type multidrug transport system fused ATPase/permease subunit
MIKHFFSVLIFIFIIFFIYFTISTYVSNNNKKKINYNRANINSNIKEKLSTLPILKNDTNDVVEFNSGYKDENNTIKRNFWNLFKKDE